MVPTPHNGFKDEQVCAADILLDDGRHDYLGEHLYRRTNVYRVVLQCEFYAVKIDCFKSPTKPGLTCHHIFLLVSKITLKNMPIQDWFGIDVLTLMGAPILVGMISHLLITSSAPLPIERLDWLYKIFRSFRRIDESGSRKNQWGIGDNGFGAFFVFFLVIPLLLYFWAAMYHSVMNDPYWLEEQGEPVPEGFDLYMISIYFGLVGSMAMSFFLIPVSRHNILLAVVGWSPFHALKLHILSGYLAYGAIALHGLTYLIYMFMGFGPDGHERVIDQIIPDAHCWVWKPSEELYEKCHTQWWNITGWIAFFFMTGLILTSLHWVRRKFYRVFYICHVVFGSLTILFSIMHFDYLVIFMFPSLIYYVASTTPVLVQALASRYRGGVKVTEVVSVKDSGGCLEVKLSTTISTDTVLEKEGCLVVKMCVPSISLIWHPFTVYKRLDDECSVRFLMRPIGPFTTTLATRLVEMPRPIMILDGLYRGGERILEALGHDVVTIVSGGVAVTPFLSMIPVLLKSVAAVGSSEVTKKIVLHWACREESLIKFVSQNYLEGFKRLASGYGQVIDFSVVIYHTTAATEIKQLEESDSEVRDDDQDIDTEEDISQNIDDILDKPPRKNDQEDESTTPHAFSVGHDMEPSRFMPALYSKILQNVPQFFFMSSSLWIGLVVCAHYMSNGHFKILHWVSAIWSILVYLMISVALFIFSEVFFLLWAKRGPPEGNEANSTTQVDKVNVAGRQKLNDNESGVALVVIEHRYSRPTATDIFSGLNTSECPGIFMCGPPGLTQMVREETAKENSHFGLTRYAVYEEPFEL